MVLDGLNTGIQERRTEEQRYKTKTQDKNKYYLFKLKTKGLIRKNVCNYN
jgi:hypothetical protein